MSAFMASAARYGWIAAVGAAMVVAAVAFNYVDSLHSRISAMESPLAYVVGPIQESVVRVSVLKLNGTNTLATGFYIDHAGSVMTAAHVAEDAALIAVTDLNIVHRLYFVKEWLHGDRVVVLTPQSETRSQPLAFARSVEVGQSVMALGWPENQAGDIGLVTRGYVAGENAEIDMLVLDLPSSHGGSGSPVVDRNGRVIGVVKLSGTEGDMFTYAIDVTRG